MRRIAVLRHGIVINRLFMEPLAAHLRRRGYQVDNRGYPSTRKRIAEHARDLAEDMAALEREARAAGGPWELCFVTHSMAGLVVRYALTHFPMPEVKRIVQIVPPNQGSATARYFKRWLPYRWIFGSQAGAELASDPPGIFAECGIPQGVEIGIVAGDVRLKVYPGVPLARPHDGIVAVSEARLGEFPLICLPYHHTPILFRKRTWEEAERFLACGEFSPRAREPSCPP